MAAEPASATFERLTELDAPAPTLIEGLPGHGLVASIAVDQINRQLGLEHHGNVVSDRFPPVITFQNGLVRDLVRVYAGSDPAVMTLQSDLALPPAAFEPLASCVLSELAPAFDRGIFLAGAPAATERQVGEVTGVATTPGVKEDLAAAGIDLAEEPGLVGGVTGALVKECFHAEVPAAILIVRAHPFLPDPGAAQAVIEDALEPLVDFEIDTSELREQADEIQRQLQQIAEQYQQTVQESQQPAQQTTNPSMFQ